jgi:uncharacterized delta-60 repeat protein
VRAMGRAAVWIGSLALAVTAGAAPGDLDPTFGVGGKVVTPVGYDGQARALVQQTDGKLVAAGLSNDGVNQPDFALVRYNADGSLDPTFGVGGKVTTPIGIGSDYANALVQQTDGKLVAAGTAVNVGSDSDFALVRYNADGSLDATFGVGGRVTTAIGTREDEAQALVQQTDGKLVAAGFSSDAGNSSFTVVRYNTDGALDGTFGAGGKVTTQVGTSFNVAFALVQQGDGKLVAAGMAFGAMDIDFALARYNTDGSLDPTFGVGGIVATPIGPSDDFANALVLQTDGKLVAAGGSYNNGPAEVALARYNADGTLDSTFGVAGTVSTPIGGMFEQAQAVVQQPDGKLVAAGFSINDVEEDMALVRYQPDGSLDERFGVGGKLTTSFGAMSPVIALALVQQVDGRLVAAGSTGAGDVALARYLNSSCGDATIDPGEQCDGGACCTDTCQYKPAMTACRAIAGPCDVPESCDGASADCPADGFASSSVICRPAADTCDLPESCTGTSTECPADAHEPDSDGDGTCDAEDNCVSDANTSQDDSDGDGLGDVCDPCTNGATATRQRLTMTKLLPPLGDEGFVLKGEATIPTLPTLDPLTRGVRVLLTGPASALLDVGIPGGPYDPVLRAGWRANRTGTAWAYKGTGAATSGIRTVRVRRNPVVPGGVKFSVKAKGGTYAVTAADVPVTATLVFDVPLAMAGQCAILSFPATPFVSPSCALLSGGAMLKCK